MQVMHVHCDRSGVLNDFLRVLRLSCTELAGDEDALVLAFVAHAHPRALSDGKDVRRVLVSAFAAVLRDDRVAVEWEGLVRVDGYQEQARVRLFMIVMMRIE